MPASPSSLTPLLLTSSYTNPERLEGGTTMSTVSVSVAVRFPVLAVAVLVTSLLTGMVVIPFGPPSFDGELCWSGIATEPNPPPAGTPAPLTPTV